MPIVGGFSSGLGCLFGALVYLVPTNSAARPQFLWREELAGIERFILKFGQLVKK